MQCQIYTSIYGDISTGGRSCWIFKATPITRSAVYHKAKLPFHCTQCVLTIVSAYYLHYTYNPSTPYYYITESPGWFGSVIVGRQTCDQEVVSLTPGQCIAG